MKSNKMTREARNLNRSIQLIKSIHQALDENKFLQVNTALLLALSGGQDSMALLSIFLQRKNQRRYRVGLCWCNHLWRCDSFYTMHHLMRLAFTLGEPIYCLVEPSRSETNVVSPFPITEGEALASPKVSLRARAKRFSSPKVITKGDASERERPFVNREIRSLAKRASIARPLLALRETFGDSLLATRVAREGYSQRVDCPEARSILTFYASLLCSQGQERVSFFFPFLDSLVSPKVSRKARSGLRARFTQNVASPLVKCSREAKGEKRRVSLTEEGARHWRYQSCQRIATFHGYRILQVGHTASDRIETGFFNLLRGSGMKGVATIQWNRVFKTVYPKYFYFSNFYASRSDNFEIERCE